MGKKNKKAFKISKEDLKMAEESREAIGDAIIDAGFWLQGHYGKWASLNGQETPNLREWNELINDPREFFKLDNPTMGSVLSEELDHTVASGKAVGKTTYGVLLQLGGWVQSVTELTGTLTMNVVNPTVNGAYRGSKTAWGWVSSDEKAPEVPKSEEDDSDENA
jgi:hypothetical protein